MTTTPTRPAASHRTFSRSAVYLEFRSRDAKAIDQSTFADRAPAPIKEPLGRGSALSHAPFPPEVSSGLSARLEKGN